MPILARKSKIGDYHVIFPIKDSSYAETYRVKDASGKIYFMKLFNYAKLHRTQFDEDGNILEINISRKLEHPNILSLHDSGEIILDNLKYAYAIYDFVSGETIAEKISREQSCSVYDAKQIVLGVLEGLKYLHNLQVPVIHNEVTIQNVMLDMTHENAPKLIDYGYARYLNQGHKAFFKDGLNPFYMASETYNGVFSPQSDLYSAGVMLYHLLFGIPPYFVDLSKYQADRESIIDVIVEKRKAPLQIPVTGKEIFDLDEQLINVIAKATAENIDERFKTADEFIKALNGEIKIEANYNKSASSKHQPQNTNSKNIKKGNGFSDVAGMSELKEQLQSDVIDLLKNPEQAKALGLSLPNGLLFYGPPGCGKTFFAEKFAEELGCNYQYVKCSDVASPYIHGGQGKIAALFDQARENAPTILFLDEVDAMITDRSKHNNVSEAGEVNEFLAQINNCGECGVIVIGATNKPKDIDEAALRAGRLELKYYIPQPDLETRRAMFEINLRNRKVDFGIDYVKLAQLTENYVSADIKLIVDQAARLVFRRRLNCITMAILEEAIQNTKPSLTNDIIKKHETMRDEFEGRKPMQTERPRIGFH